VDILVNKVQEAAVELLVRFWVTQENFAKDRSEATLLLAQMCKTEGLELAVPLYKNI